MKRPNAVFVLDREAFDLIYGDQERTDIAQRVNLIAPHQTRESIASNPALLKDVDVLFSGWGCPVMDASFLEKAPKLKTVFYGAGAIGSWTTDAFWQRNIAVTCAAEANAIPVAEYAMATIVFSLKHGWSLARRTRSEQAFPDRNGAPGCYGSTIGLVSLGAIGRKLIERLRPLEVSIIAYDPFVTAAEAAALGVKMVSLDTVFRRSDVISLHTPLLDETVEMIRGEHFQAMKPGATFINTARGEIVNEPEMLRILQSRPDLHAVLDVTVAEPPAADSPLYTLPNVTLTPHIAGSVGQECRRMGRWMVEELDRYLLGQPMKYQVKPSEVAMSTHRPVVKKITASVFTNPPPSAKVSL